MRHLQGLEFIEDKKIEHILDMRALFDATDFKISEYEGKLSDQDEGAPLDDEAKKLPN